MSIDIKDYAGELQPPAAVEQETNSFQKETVGDGLTSAPTNNASVEGSIRNDEPVSEDPQLKNFRALADSVDKIKAEREQERKDYQLQLDMLRANMARQGANEGIKQKKLFDGMDDNDIPNVADLRKAWGEREAVYNEQLEELHVQRSYPDYAEVLEKYAKPLAQTDPMFIQGLKGAENKALFAYQYAKREQRLRDLEETVRGNNSRTQSPLSTSAEKMIENARKPGTLAQAGGQSVLSKADYYATMSDGEFAKMVLKNLEAS